MAKPYLDPPDADAALEETGSASVLPADPYPFRNPWVGSTPTHVRWKPPMLR
jgi:hypothetical protein